MIEEYDLIVFEDLQIKNMVKNKHLSKSIHDAAWSSLIQYTKYKAEEAGSLIELVNPCNTSQECSICGTIIKKSLYNKRKEQSYSYYYCNNCRIRSLGKP